MMTASTFKIWLSGAVVGDELEWHVGDLTADTDPARGASAETLNGLLGIVLGEAGRGRVKLRQEALPAKGECRHIARRIS